MTVHVKRNGEWIDAPDCQVGDEVIFGGHTPAVLRRIDADAEGTPLLHFEMAVRRPAEHITVHFAKEEAMGAVGKNEEVVKVGMRSAMSEMQAILTTIEAYKQQRRAAALADERCSCGERAVGATWAGEVRPNVGIVERLLCSCAAGHEWWAAVLEENP